MATIQLASGKQAQAWHVGLNSAYFRISLSVTPSAGDIYLIGKLPHGAIPLDGIFYNGTSITSVTTGVVFKIGTSASPDMFFSSATHSYSPGPVTSRVTNQLGTAMQISLSDDAMPRYENITFVPTAAGFSVGWIGDLILYYRMPGQTI